MTARESDTDRLLRLLREHPEGMTHRDLYRRGMMVHSRAADLRRRGYAVECERKGADYVWRLV